MKITPAHLVAIMGCSEASARLWVDALNPACERYQINTPRRVAAFLAQIGHESGRLRYVKELWGPTPQQQRYEGRKDLGNTVPGDGFLYRGRGLIQVTGRANYKKCGDALGLDLVSQPNLLETQKVAALSAAWFWDSMKLNELADAGDNEAIGSLINTGRRGRIPNGAEERMALYQAALKALA
jgi:putative chitinase